ncbi:MAG: PD-(D/E)XK nuclease family protein [Schwartzia sp.]|nr:PD-(D/E)XK nuclease family protein [Schwartzia sp. (in: firmicutes)]
MSKLTFIMGRAGTGKSRMTLEAMRREMETAPLGAPIFLIVPEAVTYAAERELASFMGDANGEGFMRANVFGFQRFSERTLLRAGLERSARITELGKRLMLKKILRAKEDNNELTSYARAAKKKGFTSLISDVIRELKSYRITPEALKAIADSIELRDSPISLKLSDISKIYEALNAAVESDERLAHARMAEDILSDAADWLESDDGKKYLKESQIYIDGFLFFNAQEKRILRVFLSCAKFVTVTLTLDEKNSSLFFRSEETKNELKEIAEEVGAEIKEVFANQSGAPRPPLAEIENILYESSLGIIRSTETPHNLDDSLRIFALPARQREAVAVAIDMLRLVRDEKYMWRDITVLVSNDAAYGDIIARTFSEYRIPFFTTHKITAAHHPIAELIRSAIDTARHGFVSESIFAMLKTGLIKKFPISDIDLLENYCIAFGIDGKKRWGANVDEPTDESLAATDWTYSDKHNFPDDGTLLQKLNLMRRIIVTDILKFRAALKKSKSAKSKARAIYDFLISHDVRSSMKSVIDAFEADGDMNASTNERRTWDGVMELLSETADVFGDESMSLDELSDLLSEGLETISLGAIPRGQDAVTVMSFDESSRGNLPAVYVIGADANNMPRQSPEGRLLTDADRAILNERGIDLPLGSWDFARLERFRLYRGLTLARRYMWMSYSTGDAEGKAITASPILETISKSAGITVNRIAMDDSAKAIDGKIDLPKISETPLDNDSPIESISKETAHELYAPEGILQGSVTAFECYGKCPFHYFAQYGLRLGERLRYEYSAGDAGTLLHAVMQSFGEIIRESGINYHEIEPDILQRHVDDILAIVIDESRHGILKRRGAYIGIEQKTRRAAHNLVSRWAAMMRDSKFEPWQFEKVFSEAIEKPYWSEAVSLIITGKIDRIDYLPDGRNYYDVVDYKTGNPPTRLADIYYGIALQLMTYLWVAGKAIKSQRGSATPAGVFYSPLHDQVIGIGKAKLKSIAESGSIGEEAQKSHREKMKLTGWMTDDNEVLKQLDESDENLPAKISSNRKSKFKKGRDDFATLMSYIEYKLGDIGRNILSGNISVSPYTFKNASACSYCEYAACCRFNRMDASGYNALKPIGSDDEVINLMQKEMTDNGLLG